MMRGPRAALALLTLVLMGAACGNAATTVSSGSASTSGITDSTITVGSIANVTGILSSDFAPAVDGVKAYFDMVNAHGGVDGRKLVLGYQKDDQGSQATDLTDAQQLVEQDHVFAVVGVATPFFGGATYLAHQGVPTFGYQVSTEWDNSPSLFAAYGSYLDFSTGAMGWSWLAKQLHATSVGVISYGVAQSADACQAAITGFGQFGIPVGYQDLAYGIGADPTPDVLAMKSHHVDAVFTCLDVSGNIAFARAMAQNGLNAHQVWLNGYDRSTVQQYGSLLNGVTVALEHVPFEAVDQYPGVYPGMANYLAAMHKYQPAYEYDEVALDGWINANQFVTGLQAVGRNVTQAKLVAAINKETNYTSSGLQPPLDWTRSHTQAVGPFCGSYVEAESGKWVPEFVQGSSSVFVCFQKGSDTPVAPLPGTPGG